MKVLLDTNFLLIPGQFKVDIFSEINRHVPQAELITLRPVVIEIEKIASGRSKDARAAKLAKQLLERVRTVDVSGPTDRVLLKYAREHECIVCTNDKELRSSLKRLKIKTIFLRNKNHLEIE